MSFQSCKSLFEALRFAGFIQTISLFLVSSVGVPNCEIITEPSLVRERNQFGNGESRSLLGEFLSDVDPNAQCLSRERGLVGAGAPMHRTASDNRGAPWLRL
jgi:hypothetical protein